MLALTPPIARDALIHHLAIPKLWLIHGGFYETPWAEYSYYPMNLSLLYLIPLYFGNDIIPNFIHLAFGIGTGALLYDYLNKRCGQLAGLLGALLFISLPIILRTATTAYVDVGLVFFVTLSSLAFLYWRDAKYKNNGWLLISAAAMGLALGTKYSALPAWFFLTLAVVFIYSRDTGRQGKALQYGLLSFLVSLAVFSPWMMKNALLTGNPLFPLYKSVFGAGGASSLSFSSVVSSDVGWGVFRIRQILYGDSFWETLLIPLRFFLQGQDNTPRYFDGVLNPVLPFLVPFAFMNGKLKMEKLFFLTFAVFFILLAFFTDKHRIRYILPAVPLVIILTVVGLNNVFNWIMNQKRTWRSLGLTVFVFVLAGMVGFNAVYAKNYFMQIAPVDYVVNKESRDQFISRHVANYPAVQFINRHTPENSKILLILLAGRGYYLDRPYEENASFGMNIIHHLVSSSQEGEEAFRKYLRSLNCTHILIRQDLFHQFVQDHYSAEQLKKLYTCLSRTTTRIFRDPYCEVIQLQ
ncbi:MAG TPA: glycosyltransferase family 39 protein [Smithellaceae bacterium]|nr:glycosyltransferase family 39 protein [Smithellaceae bacterium]HQM44874.1 glycosyltransferase family 39 protein [Smithellaceae bacterium]